MENERQLDLESIKTHKNDLIRKLAYLNGKRDELTENIAYLNALINSITGASYEETEENSI